MKSLGWVLVQYDWCPCKKKEFEHRDTPTGRLPREEAQEEDGQGQAAEPSRQPSADSGLLELRMVRQSVAVF